MKKLIIVSTLVLLAISGYGQTIRNSNVTKAETIDPYKDIKNSNATITILTTDPLYVGDTAIDKTKQNSTLTKLQAFSLLRYKVHNLNKDKNIDTKKQYLPQLKKSEMPAVINGSNILPAGYSNFQINFIENKLSATIGTYKENDTDLKNRRSGELTLSIDAEENSINIFDFLRSKNQYEINGKFSYLASGKVSKFDNDILKQKFSWFNFSGKVNYSKYDLFDATNPITINFIDTASWGGLANISYNYYRYSGIKGNKFWNAVGNIGFKAGYTDNFTTLKKEKFRTSKDVVDDGSVIQTNIQDYTAVDKTKYSGSKFSFTLYGEFYKHLFVTKYTTIFLANTLQYNFGQKLLSISIGPSVNLKKPDPTDNSKKKDIINLALIVDMPGVNQNDFDLLKTGGVYLRTAIPLLFN